MYAQSAMTSPLHDRVVILADDLTGACDSGAAFLESGRAVRVWFGPKASFSAPEPVQAFTTNSRDLPPRRAADVVSNSVSSLSVGPRTLLFKKVDSAARGPLAAEVLAAHKALKTRAVVFAPAFPANGRTVREGILSVRDASGQHNQVDLRSLFPSRARSSIALVPDASRFEPVLNSGKTILICDSAIQSDLDALARIAQTHADLLFAGSAGLARALAGLHSNPIPAMGLPNLTRILVIAGTPHPVTQLQLARLERKIQPDIHLLRIDDHGAARGPILAAFKQSAPRALVLTGGDTALLADRTFGAHSFILQGELAPGIPWGVVQGGAADGCAVVTKSGGFGSPTALTEIVAAFRGSQ